MGRRLLLLLLLGLALLAGAQPSSTPQPSSSPRPFSTPAPVQGCYSIGAIGSLGYADYNGSLSKTTSGKNCSKWTDVQFDEFFIIYPNFLPEGVSLQSMEAFCRDPLGRGFPWCYTDLDSAEWESCDLVACSSVEAKLVGGLVGPEDRDQLSNPLRMQEDFPEIEARRSDVSTSGAPRTQPALVGGWGLALSALLAAWLIPKPTWPLGETQSTAGVSP